MKSIKKLWDELKALSTSRKGTDKRPWELRSDDIANSILLYISSHWTVQEILNFKEAWDNSGKFQLPPKPAKTAIKAWKKWLVEAARTDSANIKMTCVLKAVAQCALISIGAKCYADCKRDSVAVALTLDIEPYFKQTPRDIDRTMPNSIVNTIRGMLENTINAPRRNGGGSFYKISQEDFAKECGRSKRQVGRWENGKSAPPCVYDETTGKMVTYSAELRQDPVKAHVFAMNYKTHKRVKRNMHGATQYKAGLTDEANYRIQHGIPKSTQGRKSDYEGEIDAKGIAGLRKAVFE